MKEDTTEEIGLMDYIQVIRKRKWLIILGTLLCMVVAGGVSLLMPKIYEAKTYLMVTAPKYQVEFATKEGSKISTPIFEHISAETYSKVILNEHTAKTVLAKNGMDNPPHQYSAGRLLSQMRVEYPRNTNLILLRFQDTSKERAALIANTWASAFIERNEEVISRQTTNTYDFVMAQLEKAKESLKKSEEELERFQKSNKMDLVKEQISGKIRQIVQYETKLDDVVRSQLIEKARSDELLTQIMADMKLKVAELGVDLQKQRTALERTNQELQKESKHIPVDKGLIGKEDINPLYTDLTSRRAGTAIRISMLEAEKDELLREQEALEKDIQEEMKRTRGEDSSSQRDKSQRSNPQPMARQKVIGYTNATDKDLKEALMKSQVSIQSFNAEILQLKRNLKSLNEQIDALRRQQAEQELIQTRLVRNVDTARTTFDILAKKGEETKVSSAIRAGTIQVSVPATPPEFPIKPKKLQNILIAGVAGLLVFILAAFFMEFLGKNSAGPEKPV